MWKNGSNVLRTTGEPHTNTDPNTPATHTSVPTNANPCSECEKAQMASQSVNTCIVHLYSFSASNAGGGKPTGVISLANAKRSGLTISSGLMILPCASAMGICEVSSSLSSDLPRSSLSVILCSLPFALLLRSKASGTFSLRSIATKDLGSLTLDQVSTIVQSNSR
jgi:hypothetical protein